MRRTHATVLVLLTSVLISMFVLETPLALSHCRNGDGSLSTYPSGYGGTPYYYNGATQNSGYSTQTFVTPAPSNPLNMGPYNNPYSVPTYTYSQPVYPSYQSYQRYQPYQPYQSYQQSAPAPYYLGQPVIINQPQGTRGTSYYYGSPYGNAGVTIIEERYVGW